MLSKMRIIESNETTLPELELDDAKPNSESKKTDSKQSLQRDLFDIAQQLHTVGNQLSKLATKL